jgi:hypothetical protein
MGEIKAKRAGEECKNYTFWEEKNIILGGGDNLFYSKRDCLTRLKLLGSDINKKPLAMTGYSK